MNVYPEMEIETIWICSVCGKHKLGKWQCYCEIVNSGGPYNGEEVKKNE